MLQDSKMQNIMRVDSRLHVVLPTGTQQATNLSIFEKALFPEKANYSWMQSRKLCFKVTSWNSSAEFQDLWTEEEVLFASREISEWRFEGTSRLMAGMLETGKHAEHGLLVHNVSEHKCLITPYKNKFIWRSRISLGCPTIIILFYRLP